MSWPRTLELNASGGDILEVVRRNNKQRYQLGLKGDGCRYIRAAQGRSRREVGEANLLEALSEETLPDTLLHGTSWSSYESIQQRGLLPGKSQETKGKSGRKGREGRQHAHFYDDSGGVSDSDCAHIDTPSSVAGVRFFISKNGVYLTPDCINSF